MKVLVLADDCNPDWPSIPAWTYQFICTLAEYVGEVQVATQVRNKSNIERDGFGKAKVTFIDTEWIAGPIHNLGAAVTRGGKVGKTLQTALYYPGYLAFEWSVWQNFKDELNNGYYDVVHRISPLSPTVPSLIASLISVPFVIGPINGGLQWPKNFQAELSREREWLSYFREFYKLLPYYYSTYNRASCILAGFEHTIVQLPKKAQPKTINFPDVGLSPALFNLPKRTRGERLNILFVGRLVPYKLPEVVVRAFANSKILQKHHLLVVGEGPEYCRLERLIEENHLQSCVTLAGHKTQAEVGQIMRQSDIFAFPSIRELGAGVVVEAMASGLACVVVDYGGPGALIDTDRGIKVPLENIDSLISRFQEELENLVVNPERIDKLGLVAHQYAMEYYSWENKARKTVEIYNWVTHPQTAKPSLLETIK